MQRDLDEMSDEDLLAFTQPLEAARDTREVECEDCGRVFQAENRTWNARRCPQCQKNHMYGENIHHDRRRTGDGLKNGLTRRVR